MKSGNSAMRFFLFLLFLTAAPAKTSFAQYSASDPLAVTRPVEHHQQTYYSVIFDDPTPTLGYEICNTAEEESVVSWRHARLGRGTGDPLPPFGCINRIDVVDIDDFDESDLFANLLTITSPVFRRGYPTEEVPTAVWCRQGMFDLCSTNLQGAIRYFYFEVWSTSESGSFGRLENRLLRMHFIQSDNLVNISVTHSLINDTLLTLDGTSEITNVPSDFIESSSFEVEIRRLGEFIQFEDPPPNNGDLVVVLPQGPVEDLVFQVPVEFFGSFGLSVVDIVDGEFGVFASAPQITPAQ